LVRPDNIKNEFSRDKLIEAFFCATIVDSPVILGVTYVASLAFGISAFALSVPIGIAAAAGAFLGCTGTVAYATNERLRRMSNEPTPNTL